MLEVTILSLMVGSLGLQAIAASRWLRWQQMSLAWQHEEEEELLTPYESKSTDMSNALRAESASRQNGETRRTSNEKFTGWEFKIVRAHRDLFRDSMTFRRLCEEEAHAGWVLLEKLDDRRVRFKRSLALRDIIKPEALSIDPYRTHYGSSSSQSTWLLGIAIVTATILPAFLGYALVVTTLNNSRDRQPAAAPSTSPQFLQPTQPAITPSPASPTPEPTSPTVPAN